MVVTKQKSLKKSNEWNRFFLSIWDICSRCETKMIEKSCRKQVFCVKNITIVANDRYYFTQKSRCGAKKGVILQQKKIRTVK